MQTRFFLIFINLGLGLIMLFCSGHKPKIALYSEQNENSQLDGVCIWSDPQDFDSLWFMLEEYPIVAFGVRQESDSALRKSHLELIISLLTTNDNRIVLIDEPGYVQDKSYTQWKECSYDRKHLWYYNELIELSSQYPSRIKFIGIGNMYCYNALLDLSLENMNEICQECGNTFRNQIQEYIRDVTDRGKSRAIDFEEISDCYSNICLESVEHRNEVIEAMEHIKYLADHYLVALNTTIMTRSGDKDSWRIKNARSLRKLDNIKQELDLSTDPKIALLSFNNEIIEDFSHLKTLVKNSRKHVNLLRLLRNENSIYSNAHTVAGIYFWNYKGIYINNSDDYYSIMPRKELSLEYVLKDKCDSLAYVDLKCDAIHEVYQGVATAVFGLRDEEAEWNKVFDSFLYLKYETYKY